MAKMTAKEVEKLIRNYKEGKISSDEFYKILEEKWDGETYRNEILVIKFQGYQKEYIEAYQLINNREAKCDMCGKKYDYWDCVHDYRYKEDFGYGSKYDMFYLDMHLCIDCIDNMVEYILSKCKKNPLHHVDTDEEW